MERPDAQEGAKSPPSPCLKTSSAPQSTPAADAARSRDSQAQAQIHAEPPTPPESPLTAPDADDNDSGMAGNSPKKLEPRHGKSDSKTSGDTTPSTRSKKEYLDSLVPPSGEDFSRISEVQATRQREQKRRSREQAKEKKSVSQELQRQDEQHSVEGGRPHHQHRSSILSWHGHGHGRRRERGDSLAASALANATEAGSPGRDGDVLRHRAATLIQKTYRGYRTRREMKGLGIDANTRWTHALRDMQFRELTRPRPRLSYSGGGEAEEAAHPEGGKGRTAGQTLQPMGSESPAKSPSSARYNWRKVATIARHAGRDADDDSSSASSDLDSDRSEGPMTPEMRREAQKKRMEAKMRRRNDTMMMGLQYFLEMVDLKHRYGSNLRTYHEVWKSEDTNENFFYWLDYGEGRNVEVAACPRERLEREQVRYLGREERQYYLVKVDGEGRLCWAKNGARVDTTEKWKDSIHGIVPADDPTPPFRTDSGTRHTALPGESPGSGSHDDDASESELEAARAAKYANPGLDGAKGVKKVTHLSATTILDALQRKSVRKNTWIFVADTSFRLYVGIKDSGAFQHSSFVQGSRVSAAGLIRVRDGRLASLSPLSGHYRPPASNFRAFVRSLREEGVNMRHVSVSKSYAVLVGLEMYVEARRRGKGLARRLARTKDKVVRPEEVTRREESERDKSESAEKERLVLERQRQRREEEGAGAHIMQKLGISSPAVSEGQRGEGDDAEERQRGADAAASVDGGPGKKGGGRDEKRRL